MTKRYLKLLILVVVMTALTACHSEKTMKPDTPDKAGILLKHALTSESSEMLDEILIEGKRGTLSNETLNEIKKKVTSGAELKTYEVLKFENGEMVLLSLSEDLSTGEYKIADMKVVPKEMKVLFE